jgi:hypothetical protein
LPILSDGFQLVATTGVTDFNECTLVFIIRLWFEPREIEGAESEFRGVVEQVATGERLYFRDMNELPDLMVKFLDR